MGDKENKGAPAQSDAKVEPLTTPKPKTNVEEKEETEASCDQVDLWIYRGKVPWIGGVGANIIMSVLLVILAALILYLGFSQFRQSGMLTINNTTANMTSALSPVRVPSLIKPVEGIGLFAVIYLFAQLVERMVEPFSEWSYFFGSTQSIKEKKLEIDFRESAIKKKLENGEYSEDIKNQKKDLDRISKSKECMETIRKTRLWAFSSILGIIICYAFIGLFELAGIPIPHIWDALFSGMLIGGGTKSLHDFIDKLEKKK